MVTRGRVRGVVAAVLAAGAVLAAAAPAQALTTDRWSGGDRYATAATVSKKAFPDGAPVVVVVNGTSFADALAAAPLASVYDAPLLTTTAGQLPEVTRIELNRLRPQGIWVVGGTAAVSDAVLRELGTFASDGAERIRGANRYGTAAEIATQEFVGETREVYVASGEGFPDALAAGAAGAAQGSPLVLTAKDSLPAESRSALEKLAPTRITVVGGTSVVSPAVQAQLEAAWPGTVQRINGDDRYGTAAAVALAVRSTAPGVLLASGANFPDALAGAALGEPLLLSRPDCLPKVSADAISALGAQAVIGLGGTSVLSDAALGGTVCSPPTAAPTPSPTSGTSMYANCDEVRAAGKAPIRRGDPGYESKLDRDGDGIGCETT